ncbi:integrase family protein [Vibrio vulnificus]|nr:integrase family protein [Vibrio vulnificus]EJE8668417.1 integrase family protein [Vibrio vulnificus]EKD9068556.1 integrase family protein [Vibrio vulnificus]ELV8710837.1 integrase family protein [Vibrio vulnificus]
MKNSLRFTVKELTALKPTNKRTRYHDTAVDGLVIEVSPLGTKSFRVYKRAKGAKSPSNVSLGQFPSLTIDQARTKAREALNELAMGINPNERMRVEKNHHVSLQKVFDDYRLSKSLSINTLKGYEQALKCYFSTYLKKPLMALTEEAVKKLHAEISAGRIEGMRSGSHAQADLCMRLLRALFNYAKYEYRGFNNQIIFAENPVKILSHQRAWHNVERRRTYIRTRQLKEFFDVLHSKREKYLIEKNDFAATVCDLVEMASLTGLRRNELLTLEWKFVDLEAKTFYVSKTKNGVPLELPISRYLHRLLNRRIDHKDDREFVFNVDNVQGRIVDPRKVLDSINSELSFSFTLHDLRRTYTTIAESLSLGTYTIKRLLNHKSKRDDVTEGYTILTPEELRTPAQRIEDYILETAEVLVKLDGDPEKQPSESGLDTFIGGLKMEEKKKLIKMLMDSL